MWCTYLCSRPGKVYYVGNDLDKYGANMVLIVHNVNGKLVFSQYAHLSGYNVSVNEIVDTDTAKLDIWEYRLFIWMSHYI